MNSNFSFSAQLPIYESCYQNIPITLHSLLFNIYYQRSIATLNSLCTKAPLSHKAHDSIYDNCTTYLSFYNILSTNSPLSSIKVGQDSSRFTDETKFWVTAIVFSRLRTACHIPPGTNTVYPGFWMNSLSPNYCPLYFYLI